MKRTFVYEIDEEYAGHKIGRFLKERYKYSSKLITALKKTEDGILKNNERAFTSHILNRGDILTININEEPSENIVKAFVNFEIVYEDEDMMVINKPSGVPTHPSMDNYENSVANGIMYYFGKQGKSLAFHAVNRLDKDTSGLMIVAKNPYVHARLSDCLHTDTFIRKYKCIVHGIADNEGIIDAPIKRKEDSAIERCVSWDGQRAVTKYKKIAEYNDFSELEIELETGRTHQIRVHMAYIGHPLVGDFLYGVEERDIAKRQFLHSYYIEFIHPVTDEKMKFEIENAEDMMDFKKNSQKKH